MVIGTQSSGMCCGADAELAGRAGTEAGLAAAEVPAPGVDIPRIERAVRELLLAIGEDPQRVGLLDTPARVARAYAHIFGGMGQSAADHLGRIFAERTEGVIVCRDIEFHSMCEHHLLPFSGRAHVAYVPEGDFVVGLSKLARTVDVFARRAQVQERMTAQIADAMVEHVRCAGVLVVIESEHLCMKMRGVGKQGSTMVTYAARGVLERDPAKRAEVMTMMGVGRRPAAG